MLNKSRRRRRRGGKRKKVRSLSWATTINTEPLIYWWDCYFFFFFFSSYFPHHVSTTKFVEYIPLISLDEQNLRKLQFTKWKTKNAPNQCSRLGKQKTERANPIHVNGFIVTTFFSLFLSFNGRFIYDFHFGATFKCFKCFVHISVIRHLYRE